MFKVKWDVQNNGIILSNEITDEDSIPAPRPVYLQELQILEVNKMLISMESRITVLWKSI